MADGMLSLSWNNHSTTFSHNLAALKAKERYTDVTLACGGRFYQVHKLVLSTCSEYFENMFDHTPCKHPVIVLSEIHCEELEALLSYMYSGYVNVAENSLARLIKVAELLEVKGLAVPDEPLTSGKRASSSKVSSVARNMHYYSGGDDRDVMTTKSRPYSDDRTRPHPKRQRTKSDWSPCENTLSSDKSPLRGTLRPAHQDHRQSSQDDDNDNDDDDGDNEDSNQRICESAEDQSVHQHQQQQPHLDRVQVTLNEILIKEEVNEDVRQIHSRSPKCEGMTLNTAGGGGGQGSMELMIPKYDQSSEEEPIAQIGLEQQPPLHEAVIEALAGPSGIQGARLGKKGHKTGGTDTPKKKHQCPYCLYCTARKDHLQKHIRTHTGEKPYACRLCPYRSSQKYNLKSHEFTHKL